MMGGAIPGWLRRAIDGELADDCSIHELKIGEACIAPWYGQAAFDSCALPLVISICL